MERDDKGEREKEKGRERKRVLNAAFPVESAH